MGAMHMSLLGPKGIEKLALRNFAARQLLEEKISEIDGVVIPYSESNHYNEFVIRLPMNAQKALDWLDDNGIIGGIALSNWYSGRENDLLICATDQTTLHEIETFKLKLEELLRGFNDE